MPPVDPATSPARRYRGVTAEERTAQRRQRLLEAGLELFGTQGYANTSIREVAATARLNQRYFYESFVDREDLLYHVYAQIVTEIAVDAARAVAAADTIEEKAHAGLRVGWILLTDDKRKARIIALEVVGVSDRIEQLRRDTRHALADLTIRGALSVADDDIKLRLDPTLVARYLMGGVVETLVDWIHGDVHASVDEVLDHFTALFTAAAYAAVECRNPHRGGHRSSGGMRSLDVVDGGRCHSADDTAEERRRRPGAPRTGRRGGCKGRRQAVVARPGLARIVV
jgi:AcrR family transcriptional regulator